MVSKMFLTFFREGKLGPFILDNVYDANVVSCVVTSKFSFFFFIWGGRGVGVGSVLYMLVFSYFSPPPVLC